jgi:hypothetical protein
MRVMKAARSIVYNENFFPEELSSIMKANQRALIVQVLGSLKSLFWDVRESEFRFIESL